MRAPLRAVALLAAACLFVLTLGACRIPPPTPVPFPDDPRVLHGSWELEVTALNEDVLAFQLDAAAQRLVMWGYPVPARAFELGGGASYTQLDAAAYLDLEDARHERSLDALVAVDKPSGSVRLRVVPFGGDPAFTHELSSPGGDYRGEFTAAAGRTFALYHLSDQSQVLHWWDTLSGEHAGSFSVPRSHELRFTRSGDGLIRWDLGGWVAHVADASDPTTWRTVGLGACRSNGFGEVSPDGRWFVFADCNDNLRAADLAVDDAPSKSLGVRIGAAMAFAADASELVWVDSAGAVRSLDVATGANQVLHQLSDEDRARFDLQPGYWWGPPVYLNRAAGLLALAKGDGRVSLIALPPDEHELRLPEPRFESATLELVAELLDDATEPIAAYAFTGSAEVAGEAYEVTGSVHAHGFHKYLPAASDLLPQVSPPPTLYGFASLTLAGEEEANYDLNFYGTERTSATYHGALMSTGAVDEGYRVELRRP